MKRTRIVVVALAGITILAAAAVEGVRRHRASATATGLRAPDSVRVRVQVLNSTKTRGLARRATMLLRDRGFDVVETGTLTESRDTTLVLDLSGHPDWAKRVAALFSPARVDSRPDSSRYLDVAVVIGTSWRPPAEPFYP